MADDRKRTSGLYGPYLALALIGPVTVLIAANQWRLSGELSRLARLNHEQDQRQQSAIHDLIRRQQELGAELGDQIEALRLKDVAYFPPGAFGGDDDRAALIVRQLRGLKADSLPSLAEQKDARPTVRLLWLPESGRPTAVWLLPPDRSNTLSRLEIAQRSEPPPEGTGKVIRGVVGLLPEHSSDLNRRLDEVGLWSAPPTLSGPPPQAPAAKPLWVLEGVKAGRYHLMAGGAATDPAFRNFGRTMLDLSRRTSSRELRIH